MVFSLFAGCDKKEPIETDSDEATASEAPIKVGVSLFYRRDEYYKDLEASLVCEAEKMGYEIIIKDADTDPAKQTQQIEEFIKEGVDIIAIAPVDSDDLVLAIEDAVASGVPVLTFDGSVNTDKVLTHVVFDFYEDGYNAGLWAKEYIENKLGGYAQVAVIGFPQSDIVSGLRTDGFIDAVTELEGVEIVAKKDGKASSTESMAVAAAILSDYPDVDMFFGVNYDIGAGAKTAIEAAGSDTVVVTTAWAVEAFEELENNDPIILALTICSPEVQAADTIKAISEYFAGKDLPPEYLSHSSVYDASNINTLDYEEIVAKRENSLQ